MKKLLTGVAAVLLLTAALILLYWQLPNSRPSAPTAPDDSSSTNNVATASDEFTSTEDSLPKEDVIGPLFSPYRDIIDTGVYKLAVTEQRRYGGNSVPVTTTTYYGKGFINIIEAEGHSIATETFIDSNGAYCFDETLTTAYLMPADTVTTDSIVYKGLTLTESGTATVGTALFSYERYETEDGQIIDYLFAGKELKKLKLYSDNDYELISVEISSDISGMRTSLPTGITVITP